MKLTNGDIFKAKRPLQGLATQKFPVKTSFALIKLATKLSEYLAPIEECRSGLISRYGVKQEHGPMRIDPVIEVKDTEGKVVGTKPNPQWDQFCAEYDELMAQEVEVVVEEVFLPDTAEISPGALMALEKFIKVSTK